MVYLFPKQTPKKKPLKNRMVSPWILPLIVFSPCHHQDKSQWILSEAQSHHQQPKWLLRRTGQLWDSDGWLSSMKGHIWNHSKLWHYVNNVLVDWCEHVFFYKDLSATRFHAWSLQFNPLQSAVATKQGSCARVWKLTIIQQSMEELTSRVSLFRFGKLFLNCLWGKYRFPNRAFAAYSYIVDPIILTWQPGSGPCMEVYRWFSLWHRDIIYIEIYIYTLEMLSLHLHVLFAWAGSWTTMRPWREMPESPVWMEVGSVRFLVVTIYIYIYRIYIDLWSGNTGWSGIFLFNRLQW